MPVYQAWAGFGLRFRAKDKSEIKVVLQAMVQACKSTD